MLRGLFGLANLTQDVPTTFVGNLPFSITILYMDNSNTDRPEHVFTPRTIVTRRMFERRNEPSEGSALGVQDRLGDALRERGGQLLVYGDTGVGKSSLVKYATEDEELSAVTVECTAETDYASILHAVVQELLDVREIKFSRTRNAEMSTTVEGAVPWITKVTGTFKGALSRQSDYEVIEKPALDVATELMAKSGKTLLVLENFQNVRGEATRELVAQLLERLSDRASRDWEQPDIKCVVVGIAEDATSLLGSSRSYLRRTAQIGVPRMPDDEIRAFLARGFSILGLQVSEDLIDEFVFYSDGFPYFAHLVGLYTSRIALRSESSEIGREELQSALFEAAHSVTASYQDRVRAARESGGAVRPRAQLMSILANSSSRTWTGSDIQQLWAEKVAPRKDFAPIHVALGQLVKEEHGSILARTGKQRSYVYRFADPHIRPFLRIEEAHSALTCDRSD
ncbi:hypothetical protein CXR26_02370 [Brevibacterium aurantiacum]|nr:hypothetical protein CXR26_02370 [Brevibacterium aurantiacum]